MDALYGRIACRADELARFTDQAPGPTRDLSLWRIAESEILAAPLGVESANPPAVTGNFDAPPRRNGRE